MLPVIPRTRKRFRGTKWRTLVGLAPERLSPPVLTNNLDVTAGGAVSLIGNMVQVRAVPTALCDLDDKREI